jgi:arsenite methyltransferase
MGREKDTRGLFEDCAWLYSLFREHVFRDHTDAIVDALFSEGACSTNGSVLEIGCGPGFYARRLARRFPDMKVLGVDRSSRLISRAQKRARIDGISNCRFEQGDAKSLSRNIEPVDAVISSRLFLVVQDRPTVLNEIYRTLRPGGRLFLAEPTSTIKTQLPLWAMRLCLHCLRPTRRCSSPHSAHILSAPEFESLIHSQPWDTVSLQMNDDYQCAVCVKSKEPATETSTLELLNSMPGEFSSWSIA